MKYDDNKILLVANCYWYINNFRLDLVKKLKIAGYKVIVLAPRDSYKHIVKEYVDEVIDWKLIRGSMNPFSEMVSIFQLIFLLRSIRPKLIHFFTIKPCLYGGLASKIIGHRKVIKHITGIGPSFFGFNKRIRTIFYLLYPIYKYSFSGNAKFIFHNNNDRQIFIAKKFCREENSCTIEGSGVDLNYFNNKIIRKKYFKPIQILFPARVIREKGFIDLFEACKDLWEENYDFQLNVAGDIDKDNPSSLNLKEIKTISLNKNVNFYGKIDDMRVIYSKNDIVILPSWREGLSKALIEAAAMSLPIITSDVPGCKEIIEHEKNGILVPSKNKSMLKKAIIKLIENPHLGYKYGSRGVEIVRKKFEVGYINNQIFQVYEEILSGT